MFGASSELASVMEFGFNWTRPWSCAPPLSRTTAGVTRSFAGVGHGETVDGATGRRGRPAHDVRPTPDGVDRRRLHQQAALRQQLQAQPVPGLGVPPAAHHLDEAAPERHVDGAVEEKVERVVDRLQRVEHARQQVVHLAHSSADQIQLKMFYQAPPVPQIDIIGAMVIVWRARGKIITRSVLCSIVCNNCTQ